LPSLINTRCITDSYAYLLGKKSIYCEKLVNYFMIIYLL
jgi:hypothetical protein